MAIRDNTYLDKIMGGVQGDPNPFGYQNQVNNFVIDNEPFNERQGFNFIDAPIETPFIERAFKPEFRPFLNNPAVQNPLEKIGSGVTSVIDKTKSGIGKGIDFGKIVGSGILSAITGIPFAGQILSGITSQFENRPLGAGVIDEFGNVWSGFSRIELAEIEIDRAENVFRQLSDPADFVKKEDFKNISDFDNDPFKVSNQAGFHTINFHEDSN